MIAIDTSIVVRFLTSDDEAMSLIARRLIETETVFVGATVVLEAYWVLRSRYGYEAVASAQALGKFVALSNVRTQARDSVRRALEAVSLGLEFPDALHAELAEGCDVFITYDVPHRKRAVRLAGGIPVRNPDP